MVPFDLQCRTRIIFGDGTVKRIGELAGEIGTRRALVVSDPGIIAAGHTQRAIDALDAAGIETQLFEGVHENPTTDDVATGVAMAKRYEPELIVGLGGGSSMDCAKGINFVYTNGGEMKRGPFFLTDSQFQKDTRWWSRTNTWQAYLIFRLIPS